MKNRPLLENGNRQGEINGTPNAPVKVRLETPRPRFSRFFTAATHFLQAFENLTCVLRAAAVVALYVVSAPLATRASQAPITTFNFTVDEPCKTSAGVYLADGTLVRTLWSKVRYPAGTFSATWDGLDYNSNIAPAGTYQIKLLQHNTEYFWDGAVGNTSAEISGPTVHRGFYPMRDMAIAGTNAFYVSGYNEGMYDFRSFVTSDPQHVTAAWGADGNPANIYDPTWNWTASDGNWVYFACAAATNPTNTFTNNFPGFVVAAKVGAVSPAFSAYFSQGVPIINGAGTNATYPNGVYVGAQPGLSGLAVQQSGNLLAVSVAPDNKVYFLDKTAGAVQSTISINAPGKLRFSPDGSLWVISGTAVYHYSSLTANASPDVTIANFVEPLDVAVNLTNPNLVLVADGGSSQQIKAFTAAGAALWTYGLAGGYPVNGAAVTTNKFWFNNGEKDGTFVCFAPDGSFWVGDGGNYRSLHFSAQQNFLEQIMYQPHSYNGAVDQNNPSRVFNQFLEFSINYTNPLQQAWTLVNNWRVNVDSVHISWNPGVYEVTTFTNGRTYALVDNNSGTFALSELVELTGNQLRFTGLFPAYNNPRGWISIAPDGSARRTTIGSATWYQTTLKGFDANNNPVWNPETLLASAPQGSTDPVPRGSSFGNIRATISTNNVLISFDQSLNNGYHLGGIKLGTTNWLWRASPAVVWMDGLGGYEITNGVVYAGNTVQALDRNVIYGYHGEFFRGQGQASQHMHFYDDGLFVGQFGEANIGHSAYEGALPGSAGNGHCPSIIKTNGEYYLWVNDESGHGPQRWQFVNARNIREQIGNGTAGGTINLTNQFYNFPSGITAANGNKLAQVSWLPVAGATSYNVRYSTMNGGPYNNFAGSTTNLAFVVGGLNNGQTYYCVVSAVIAGGEGTPSEQVSVNPFDTTLTVLTAGSMTEGGQLTPVIEINSNAPASGQPSYIAAEHATGLLSLRELDYFRYGNLLNETVGTKGYYLFNWQGAGNSLSSFPAPMAINYVPGWATVPFLQRQFRVNNILGVNDGMIATPLNSLNIAVTDTNYHYLTVVSPSQFNNARQFAMRLTSASGASGVFNVNESPGYSHVFQYLFKGNATLWADSTGGNGAIVEAMFLDDAPVTYSSTYVPPVQSTSATTLSASPDPAAAGSIVTLTAMVGSSGGVPTGAVAFLDSGSTIGSATLDNSGMAVFSTTSLSVASSPHVITAIYNGSSLFTSSTSGFVSEIITNPPVITTPISSDITSGLVAWYPLAGDANDYSGAGNNGALIGAPNFTVGANGAANTALSLNGSGQYVSLGHPALYNFGTSDFTMSLWFKTTSILTPQQLLSCDDPSGRQFIFDLNDLSAGTVSAYVQSANSDVGYRTDQKIAPNTWYFAVLIKHGNSSNAMSLYLNGSAVGAFLPFQNDFPLTMQSTASDVEIGRRSYAGFTQPFGGSICGVRVYNRALVATEVATMFANGPVVPATTITAPAQIASATSLSASVNTALAGTTLAFTATVSGSGSVPTGSVTILDGTTSLGSVALNSSGVATFTTTNISVNGSPHQITAVYSGNGLFTGSTSGVVSEIITNAPVVTPPVSTSTTNGLVAWYPLAGDANDYSGAGNNGALIGAPTFTAGVTGAANTAISLNGSSQYISLGHPGLYDFSTADFSMALWFKTTSTSVPQQLLSCDDASGRQFIFDLNDLSVGTVTAYLQSQSSDVGYRTGNILSPNTWYFAVLVKQGNASGSLALYLNGSPVNSFGAFENDFPIAMQTTATDVEIGRRSYAGYTQSFGGSLSGVRVYNRALSASEVTTIYTNVVTSVVAPPAPIASTTTLNASPNPALAGSTVIFTATVTGNGGVPSGTVTFLDGTSSLSSVTLNSSGVAAFSTSSLSPIASPHSITAVYSGSSSYAASTSTVLFETITNAPVVTPPSSSDITNGLVASYPLAGNANDTSGTGNNGSLIGNPSFTTDVTGASNGAIYLNGTSQYVSLGHPSIYNFGTGDFTMSLWFKTTTTTVPQQLLSCDDTSGRQFIFDLNDLSTGTVTAYLQSQSSDVGYRTGNILSPNTWYFAVLVKHGNTSGSIALYLNGSPVNSFYAFENDFPITMQNTATDVEIGRRSYTGYTQPFSGALSGVRVYNRALSASEVTTLYTNVVIPVTTQPSQVVSTTTLAASPNPALVGNTVILSATVTGGRTVPTGTVNFLDGTTSLGSMTLNASGVAAFSTTTFSSSASPHSLTAVYSGDGSYAASASSMLSEIITNAPVVTPPSGSDITNGLVAWYPLAGDANDYSSTANNGALIGGPSFTTGYNGVTATAVSLNGSSQYVSLGHPSLYNFGTNDFTMSLWFKTTTTATPQQLLSCDDAQGRQFVFDINDLSAGTVTAYVQSQASGVGYRTGNILSPNTWYFAVLTKHGNSAGGMSLYFNGSAVTSFSAFQNDFPILMQTTTSDVEIGRRTYTGYTQPFSGSMSGVRIYNRSLAATEVATLFANGPVIPTNSAPSAVITNGLVAWYPLAGNVSDYSASPNNGTIIGGASFTTGVNGNANSAISLNGSSQYVSLNHPALYNFGTSDFSMSVWFKTTSTSVPQQLLSCDDPTGRQFVFDINDVSTGTVTAYLENQSGVVGYRTGAILSPNTWYFAVLVKHGNAPASLALYINGSALGSFSAFQNDFPLTMQATSSEVDIGRRTYPGFTQPFSGSMCGVRVYNRALTASEITTLYIGATDGAR